MKKWKYVYEDEVLHAVKDVPGLGITKTATAKHRDKTISMPITYSKDMKKCFIHTDKPIKGLKLVAENKKRGEIKIDEWLISQ